MKRLFCLTLLLALLAGCAADNAAPVQIPERIVPTPSIIPTSSPAPTPAAQAAATPTPSPAAPQSITLGFIGDILIMTRQINDAKTAQGYDFSESFAACKPLFEAVDIMCADFEGTLGGEAAGYTLPRETRAPATADNPAPTNPPMQSFSAPDELAANLYAAGIDAVTLANNHAMDRDDAGLFRTINVLRQAGIKTTGTALDANDFATPCIIERGGMSIALIGATQILNSSAPSIDKQNRAFALTWLEEGMIKSQITACKQAGAEFIIIMPHWGYEHQSTEDETQRQYAKQLIEWGADAIIGCHSHCPQPMEWMQAERDGQSITVPVVYSLGNFISNMAQEYAKYGVFARLTLTKDASGVHCSRLACLPLYCCRTELALSPRAVHRVLPCFQENGQIADLFGADDSTLRAMRKAYEHVTAVCIGSRDDIHLIERSEVYAGKA